jgi:hypothetical protein
VYETGLIVCAVSRGRLGEAFPPVGGLNERNAGTRPTRLREHVRKTLTVAPPENRLHSDMNPMGYSSHRDAPPIHGSVKTLCSPRLCGEFSHRLCSAGRPALLIATWARPLPAVTGAEWPVLARSSAGGPESIDGARHDESYTQSYLVSTPGTALVRSCRPTVPITLVWDQQSGSSP